MIEATTLALLADVKPERFPAAAVRWHGRLELEAASLSLEESRRALDSLSLLGQGHPEAVLILRRLLRVAAPAMLPRFG